MKLDDGTGTGKQVKVDGENRIHTHSFTVDLCTAATLCGCAFSVFTDNITLTSVCESALIYIKNNEDDDILIPFHSIRFGDSTGGTGPSVITMYINPTAGTIVCCTPTCAGRFNRKVGNATTLTADTFKGAEGDTLTGGTTFTIISDDIRMAIPLVLPKGATFGISITPPASNTSLVVSIDFLIIKNASKHGSD